MDKLLGELTATLERGGDCVHCLVVETRGSTPQKAGAAMLVFPDGSQFGTLGGGCVEAEVKRRALGILGESSTGPQLLTFNLDDDYGWDDGLICGGRMNIVAHPLKAGADTNGDGQAARAYFQKLRELLTGGKGCTEAVVIKGQEPGLKVGYRYLFDDSGMLVARALHGTLESSDTQTAPDTIKRHLTALEQRPRPSARQGIAYLPILPRVTLLIVGGGHVGLAVAHLAAGVDFEVWVVDDRELYANANRFPMARRIIVGDIGTQLKKLAKESITRSTYCLIVTRGHNHDEEALKHLVSAGAGFVGMIGSKRKIRLIYDDLIARGIPEEMLARVHAPLGLPIGSQTVQEIAISIVAELIAFRNLPTTVSAGGFPSGSQAQEEACPSP
jgi:xanthine dehydrogenase accessory factor